MADTYTSLEEPRDWRGVRIGVGALVIYGAPVSRSIAMVEAVVEGFTKSGRVNVRIVRRAYGHTWSDSKEVVHVGQDRLTVVGELPEPLMPTEKEKAVIRAVEQAERERVHATHPEFRRAPMVEGEPRVWSGPLPCERCGAEYRESFERECG